MKLSEMLKNTPKNEDKDIAVLTAAIDKVYALDADYKATGKIITENKNTIKEIFANKDLSEFTTDSGVKASITTIDKSTLNETEVLNYFHNHGLDKYIKTKEYFDEAEVAMAIANNELNASDFAPFMIEKTEIRLNIKKAK